nr:TetR/AcrR family transcriptional regulator [Sphingobium sp. OAS761]
MGRKGEESRRRLLDATRELLAKGSIHKLSASAIARAASMASQSFYLYFKDIEEVIFALSSDAARDMEQIVTLIRQAPPGSAPELLSQTVVDAFSAYWDRNRPILNARNYIADSGNMDFLRLRQEATMPMLIAIADRIKVAASPSLTRGQAISRAVIVYLAMERLAARSGAPQYEPAGYEDVDLREAEIDILTLLFTPKEG